MVLLLILATFTALLHATPDCTLFEGRACVYIPPGKVPTALHLYIRGHYQGRGDLPAVLRKRVARETLLAPKYRLLKTAKEKSMALVVSGSSSVSFGSEDLRVLEERYGLSIQEITISAHSGGYKGLNRSLQELSEVRSLVKRIFMLDNFYGTLDEELPGILRSYHDAGVPCKGFTTQHNLARVRAHYSFCEVEGPKNKDHDLSVGPFLQSNL